ncbi:amino acid adenylation domain-containing protein [Streptomyces sp. NRRL S-920]|uniref:amino acid adenylation domain-containing protein n=1 Tax=Streptomyces sp. NRRL S-920 TaxID=1463921 RepID=UPI00068B769E|nr:non-ribosomal peptide synthetase [Streptomyces sp. NRRL S-920]
MHPELTLEHRRARFLERIRLAAAGSGRPAEPPRPAPAPQALPTALPRAVATGPAAPPDRRTIVRPLGEAAVKALHDCAAQGRVATESVLSAALLASVALYCAESDLLVAVDDGERGPRQLALPVDAAGPLSRLALSTDRALGAALATGARPPAGTVPPLMLRILRGGHPGNGDGPGGGTGSRPDSSSAATGTGTGSSVGDVHLTLATTGTLTATYDPDRHETELIEGVLRSTEIILEASLSAPDAPLSALRPLSDDELRKVTEEPNRTARPRRPGTLTDAFDDARRQFADRTALVDAAGTLTYRRAAEEAARIGHRLRAAGAGPEDLVAVLVSRDDKRWVLACLGALHAGAAWLPIDPAVPPARLKTLLRGAGVTAVVTDATLRRRVPSGAWALIDLDDEDRDGVPADEAMWAPAPTDPRRLAYAMYTSGSTGTPRAVLVEHDSTLNFVASLQRLFELTPDDRMLQYASPGFDVSVFEIFCALLSGSSLHMIGDDDRRSVEGLTRALTEGGITVAELPPALLELMDPERVPRLRLVSVGGEPFSGGLTTRWSKGRRFVNGYGTTETTIGVIYKECTGQWRSAPPIGVPVDNHQAYILDDELRPVPPCAVGELFVGGAGVARGYLGQAARTAERFLPDPFRPGGRLYRTGDLARWSADGDIVFLGRRDRQVKVRGQRVELGEIEAALTGLPEVSAAVVADLDATLVGFVVPAPGRRPDLDEIRRHLAGTLPSYMVPALLTTVAQIPITASGKVDLAALAALRPASPARADDPAPAGGRDGSGEGEGEGEDGGAAESPRARLVRRIAEEGCATLLPGARVTADTNFFATGGDSIRAIRLLSWVREVFGAEIPMSRFFRNPTPGALAEAIERHRADPGGTATGSSRAPAPVVAAGDEGEAPLSSSQQRLWFLDQLRPGDPSYNVLEVFLLRGELDDGALDSALHELSVRHEMLRTRYVATGGVPHQVVDPEPTARLARVDLCGAPAADLDALLAAEAAQPFDLAAGPLVRVTLVRRGPREHVLAWVIHHMVADGRSTEVLFGELSSLYGSFRRGLSPDLPPVTLTFRDYARRQRASLGGDTHREGLAYWRRQLAGAPAQVELPTDRSRPAEPTTKGGTLYFDMPPGTGDRLAAFAGRAGVTPFMTLLTAFFAQLSRYGRDKDLVVGTPFANRNRRDVEDLVGFLVNTVPLRADCSGDPSFTALLQQVTGMTLAAGDHSEVPFEDLVSGLGVRRDLGVNPLVQVMFQVIDAPEDQLCLDGVETSKIPVEERAAAFDLVLELRTGRDGRLTGRLNYSTDLFDRETAARMAGHYRQILGSALADPRRRLSRLDLLDPEERRRLLGTFEEAVTTPVDTITALVERQAARRGDAVAVTEGDGQLSYRELNTAANRLAHHLKGLGVGPDVLVALCLPPSADLITAMLGVLKAGGAYLPIDPGHPAERVRLLLADCGVGVAVSRGDVRDRLPEGLAHRVDLDDDRARLDTCPTENPPGPDPRDLAYVIHTSGSTGRPKGVAVPHQALARLVLGCDQSPVGPDDTFLMVHPPSFDASNLEIWLPLAHGASTVVPPERLVDPVELGDVIRRHGVTVLWLSAPLAQMTVDTDARLLGGVRQLGIGGQAPSVPHVRRLMRELPGLRVLNCYGPTESATNTTLHHLAHEPAEDVTSIPMGRPIGDTRVYVVGVHGEPVPVGVPGELWIGGRGLARGYLGAPALTAERFVPDPFGPVGQRVYRTGDIVRRLPDGTLDFLGRDDDQVKIRGHRIELGEVATVVRGHAGVRDAHVRRHGTAGAAELAAYVVPDTPGLDTEDLFRHLRQRLPDYMVPATVTELAELPVSSNGKVDPARLPEPRRPRQGADGGRAPRGGVEKAVHAVWADVLGRDSFGVDDDFFVIGGNSYQAAQVVARLRAELGAHLSLRTLFEHRRVAELAAAVAAAAPGPADTGTPVRRGPDDAPAPLSVEQQRLWFLDQLHPGGADYNVPVNLWLRGELDTAALRAALREVVARHEVLRSRFTLGTDRLPVQTVRPADVFDLTVTDLSRQPVPQARSAAERAAAEAARLPFRLDQGPLIRAQVLRVTADEHLLSLVAHHAAVDAESFRLLLAETGRLYGAYVDGRAERLDALPVQYADYARRQRQRMPEVEDADLGYWRDQLRDLPALELPTDRPRPRIRGTAGGRHRAGLLGPADTARLGEVARAHGATDFMVLLAAAQTTLGRLSGQRDFGIGTPVSQRSRPELAPLVGFFVNTLVLRADLSGDPSFTELLARTRETALAGYIHQELPFDRIVEELLPSRTLGRTPLFDVVFHVDDTTSALPDIPGLVTEVIDVDTGTAKFDLDIAVTRQGDALACTVEFNTDLFTASSAGRLVDAFRQTLRATLADPRRRLSELGDGGPP